MEIDHTIKQEFTRGTEAENTEEPRIIKKSKEFLAKFGITDYTLEFDEENKKVRVVINPPQEHFDTMEITSGGWVFSSKYQKEKITPFVNEIRYGTTDLDYEFENYEEGSVQKQFIIVVFKNKNKPIKSKHYQEYQKSQKK